MIEEKVFVTYSFREFITDVGGLLGLFLGCSMLSLMELIFYPVVTLINYWKSRRNRKAEIPENSEILNSGANASSEHCIEFNPINAEEFLENSEIPGMIKEEDEI